MSITSEQPSKPSFLGGLVSWGMLALLVACLGAGLFFVEGLNALLTAWKLPEYSHGPLIPVLSGLLFLRQLKDVPIQTGPINDRWVGVAVVAGSLILGGLGKLANIPDIVAYALILWTGGILLISFGWKTGKHFWPPVVHLVYMLPLPDTLYYKMSTYLQFVSSELGVWFLRLLSVPVFLDGNIIDLGVLKLHVAEACSGLRYLFPILSFSYIFAVLYKGPMWHKAVLLISAAPITVFMNSVRIAIGGFLVNYYGVDWLEGFTHFFEGWVIFISCILILFLLAWVMLLFQRPRRSLVEALDLETDGLWDQAKRLGLVMPSAAMLSAVALIAGALLAWQAAPDRSNIEIDRTTFKAFPRTLGDWQQAGVSRALDEATEVSLAADDYHNVTLRSAGQPDVGLFMAWYEDQSDGGVHSPEVCLPGGGWEIAWLERTDISDRVQSDSVFEINRAIIQKGETRMMVFYWFEQKGRRLAWDMEVKFWLVMDGLRTGRTDGALVRLTTIITADETDAQAEARLHTVLEQVTKPLDRFIPAQ